jgi:SNF2 family DNA or RNA helicase
MTIEELYNRAKDNFNGRLFAPYQREGVLWMLTMENQTSGPLRVAILCDEMGLGKSAQLIATMLGNRKKSTLIVVPKSIITQWANEIGSLLHSYPSTSLMDQRDTSKKRTSL